jgi:hypothetical protein
VAASGWLSTALFLFVSVGACGAPPPSASLPSAPAPSVLGKRRVDIPADCEQQAGKPPPAPLRTTYTGLARAARCQDEVFTIMGGVTHFLGVACKHCHQEPDYAADTHNKQVANWMARELVPRLRKRLAEPSGAREVWCQDCHAGKPKLLGNPRRRDLAIDWMTTHLSESFDTLEAQPPQCKNCHGGDLGSPAFRTQVILSTLEGLPSPPPPPSAPAKAIAPPASAEPAPTPEPLPDFGGR